jgi:hypothetical protein
MQFFYSKLNAYSLTFNVLHHMDYLDSDLSLYSCSLEASEDTCYNESRKDSTSEPFNTCPLVTVSVTDETNEDLIVSKEKSKIDQDELDNTNTLDIDPASYEGKALSLCKYTLFEKVL